LGEAVAGAAIVVSVNWATVAFQGLFFAPRAEKAS